MVTRTNPKVIRTLELREKRLRPGHRRFSVAPSKVTDLGVSIKKKRLWVRLIRVAKAPARGQYSFDFAAGEYKFSRADANRNLRVELALITTTVVEKSQLQFYCLEPQAKNI